MPIDLNFNFKIINLHTIFYAMFKIEFLLKRLLEFYIFRVFYCFFTHLLTEEIFEVIKCKLKEGNKLLT